MPTQGRRDAIVIVAIGQHQYVPQLGVHAVFAQIYRLVLDRRLSKTFPVCAMSYPTDIFMALFCTSRRICL